MTISDTVRRGRENFTGLAKARGSPYQRSITCHQDADPIISIERSCELDVDKLFDRLPKSLIDRISLMSNDEIALVDLVVDGTSCGLSGD